MKQLPMVILLLLLTGCGKKEPAKPNILIILVDDLGKEWLSCYGAEDITTTNIDGLQKAVPCLTTYILCRSARLQE